MKNSMEFPDAELGSYTILVLRSQTASAYANPFRFAVIVHGSFLNIGMPPMPGMSHRKAYSVTRLSRLVAYFAFSHVSLTVSM